jgi:hypothetical protein
MVAQQISALEIARRAKDCVFGCRADYYDRHRGSYSASVTERDFASWLGLSQRKMPSRSIDNRPSRGAAFQSAHRDRRRGRVEVIDFASLSK